MFTKAKLCGFLGGCSYFSVQEYTKMKNDGVEYLSRADTVWTYHYGLPSKERDIGRCWSLVGVEGNGFIVALMCDCIKFFSSRAPFSWLRKKER